MAKRQGQSKRRSTADTWLLRRLARLARIHDILAVRIDSSGSLLGGCGDGLEIRDTAATTKTTKAVPVNVEVAEASTSATIKNTNAIVKDSNAIINTQCSVIPIS